MHAFFLEYLNSGMELLGHKICLSLTLLENVKLFSKVILNLPYYPVYEYYVAPHPQTLDIIGFL